MSIQGLKGSAPATSSDEASTSAPTKVKSSTSLSIDFLAPPPKTSTSAPVAETLAPRASLTVSLSSVRPDVKNLKAALDPFRGVVDVVRMQEAARAMGAALPALPGTAKPELRKLDAQLRAQLDGIGQLAGTAKTTAEAVPPTPATKPPTPTPSSTGKAPSVGSAKDPAGGELALRLNLQQRVDLGYGLRDGFDQASRIANAMVKQAPADQKEFYSNLGGFMGALKQIHLTHLAPDDREVAANRELQRMDRSRQQERGPTDVTNGAPHSAQLMAYGRGGESVYIGVDPKAVVMNQLADEANANKSALLNRSAGPRTRSARETLDNLKGSVKEALGRSYVPASGAPTHLNDAKLSAGYNTTKLHLLAQALDGVPGAVDTKDKGKGKGKAPALPTASGSGGAEATTPWTDLARAYYPSMAEVAREVRREGDGLPKDSPINRAAPSLLGMPDKRVPTHEKLRETEFTLGTLDPAAAKPRARAGAKLSARMERHTPAVHSPVAAHEAMDLALVKDPVQCFKMVEQWDKELRAHPARAELQQFAMVKQRLGGGRAIGATTDDFYGKEVPRQFQEDIADASPERLTAAGEECRRIGDLAANLAVDGEKLAAMPDKNTPAGIVPRLQTLRQDAFVKINKEVWLAEYDSSGKVICGGYPGGAEAALKDPTSFLAESHNALSLGLGLAGQHIAINKRELVKGGIMSARHAMIGADQDYQQARQMLDKTFLPVRKEQLLQGHSSVNSKLTVDRTPRAAPEMAGVPVGKLAMQHGSFIESVEHARDRLQAHRATAGDNALVSFADATKAALSGDTAAGIPADAALAERYFGQGDTITGVLEKYLDFAHAQETGTGPAAGAPLPNEFFRYFGEEPFKRAREVSAEAAHHAPGTSATGVEPFDPPPPLEKMRGLRLGEGEGETPHHDATSKEWQDIKATVQGLATPQARARFFTENPQGQKLLERFSEITDNLRQTLTATMHHADDGPNSRPASFSINVREKPAPDAAARPALVRSRTSVSIDIPAVFGFQPMQEILAAEPTSTSKDRVSQALRTTAATPNASVLVMGYSPTGGGHTGRTLDIAQQALSDGSIGTNSTLILHVPSKWNNQERPRALDALAVAAKDKGVTLVVCGEADKSVQGYLKESGASDDAKILSRFAQMPNRADSNATQVSDLKIFEKGGDIAQLPSITAEDLMKSVHATLGGGPTATKVRVLTDMDPALQKAAQRYGVPKDHRLDQQNHAILLDLEKPDANLDPKLAVLSKVLSGTGEIVSHIGLGDKNTLLSMTKPAQALGITRETTKAEARQRVAAHFLKYGKEAHIATASKQTEGILKHADIKDAGDVKNIVYVYAHKNQDPIATHVRAELAKGADADPAFKNTLFVFCGKAEVFDTAAVKKDGLDATGNAMHLAYLGDADGITTSGAGTHGEFSYLHKAGGAKSDLLAFPIKGHNEQKANADYLAAEGSTQAHVTVREDTSTLPQAVTIFVRSGANRADTKYADGTMATMLNAVGDKASYVQQAADLLFGKAQPTKEAMVISAIEQNMRNEPELKANRKFLKLVFQALDQVEAAVATGANVQGGLKIALTKKQKDAGDVLQFDSLAQFSEQLRDDKLLTQNLGSTVHMSSKNTVLLNDVRNFFQDVSSGVPIDPAVLNNRIHELKEKFGDTFVTGF